MLKPVFIVSLPRAGSTLLQRLLMGHPQVGSCGEPWLALPLVYMLRQEGALADYGHQSAVRSIRQLVEKLPGGEGEFYRHASDFLSGLYAARAPEGVTHFVDKTPRYYKILDELRQMFPESPIFILLRNPMGVFGSMLNFVNGDLRYLPMWKSDWLEGHERMAKASQTPEGLHVLRFEELVSRPHESVEALMKQLGLAYDPSQVEEVAFQRLGRGDPTGVDRYQKVDTAPLSSWQASIDTPTKKRVAMRWLRALPEAHWSAMGYDRAAALRELAAHRTAKKWSVKESIWLCAGRIYFYSGLHLLRKVFQKRSTNHRPFFN